MVRLQVVMTRKGGRRREAGRKLFVVNFRVFRIFRGFGLRISSKARDVAFNGGGPPSPGLDCQRYAGHSRPASDGKN